MANDLKKIELNGMELDIPVDNALSDTSENPVQNKVVTEAINKLNKLKLSYTYIGKGVDAGQNDHNPYYDFSSASNGLYLVFQNDSNTNYMCTCTLVTIDSDRIRFLQNDDENWSKDGKILYGSLIGWHCNLFVFKIDIDFTLVS